MAKTYKHYKVWLNGKVVPPEQAVITVFTQTAMRGANVYEGIRCYWNDDKKNLYVWKLDQHLKRLFESMKIMHMTAPFTFDELKKGVIDWARANEFKEDVHFRLVVYFGDGGPGGTKAYRPEEIDFGAWIDGGPRQHKDALEKGLNVCVSNWRRINDDSIPPRVKAGANYQNSRLAAIDARKNGYDDALILTRDGKLAEATGASVMMVRDGELVTPPVTSGILESITRKSLLGMAAKHRNRPPVERDIDRTELYIADELFLCGTAEEVTPVVSVDRVPVGDGKPGPVTRELQGHLFRAARGQNPDYVKDLVAIY
ncbi:MAG: branched-chain amino acid transaminase [Proteobacteria bacterium]|nr:branched-chain amino acid transaminase [Pseudomonadota bacterium]